MTYIPAQMLSFPSANARQSSTVTSSDLNRGKVAQLFETYWFLVHRRCLAILQNRDDADDAQQEVFVRVQRYGHTRTGASTLAWLYSIAFNCCCDLMKRRAKVSPTADEKLWSLVRGVEGHTISSDERALLSSVLRRLDAETREVGLLYHLKGLTQEEVASEKGYSRRTIGKKLHLFNELFQKYWLEAGGAG